MDVADDAAGGAGTEPTAAGERITFVGAVPAELGDGPALAGLTANVEPSGDCL